MSPLESPDNQKIRYVQIKPDDQDAVVQALRLNEEAFFPHETACAGVDVSGSAQAVHELNELIRACFLDGVSVGAYLGDQLVGASVNKMQTLPPPGEMSFFERFSEDRVKDPRARFVMDFMINVDSKANLFAELGAESEGAAIMEVMFLCVSPEARGHGVGGGLVQTSVDIARALSGPGRPCGLSAIFTSDISRAVGRRVGFKELVVVENAEFKMNGKSIGDRLQSWQKRSALVCFRI